MGAIAMTWRPVLALLLLATACLLAPASADARWRSGQFGGLWMEQEICRDGMKISIVRFPSAGFDHASHSVPNDTSDRQILHFISTSPPDHAANPDPLSVIYDRRDLMLPYSPVDAAGGHYDFYGTYTIGWSRLLLPGDEVGIDFLVEGPNEGEVEEDILVKDCYLSTATDGKIAFVSTRNGGSEIYTMDATGETQTNPAMRLTSNAGTNLAPAWSPDGTKIAFASTRDGGDFDIYKMNANGTTQTPVTVNTAADTSPTWSADGTQIAFSSNRDGGNPEIYKISADGTGPVIRLTNNSWVDSNPDWSPDGTKIAFETNRDGNYEIYRMDAATGDTPTNPAIRITNNAPYNDIDPAWSPDGRTILFTDGQGPRLLVNGLACCNQGETEVGGPDLVEGQGSWGPGGVKVVFSALGDGDAEIYAAPPGIQATLTNPPGAPPPPTIKLTSNTTFSDTQPDWQPVYPGYPRPKGATPTRVSLVPAYFQCTLATDNRVHGPPDFPGNGSNPDSSCNPPSQTSGYVTVGSPDAYPGTAVNSVGYVKFRALPGSSVNPADDADLGLTVGITDVRKKSDRSDYTGAQQPGELQVKSVVRIVDRLNGPTQTIPGTFEMTYVFTVPCTVTSTDATIGSACSLNTTADALIPGIIREGRRTVWQLGTVEVYDGGPDGDVDTFPNDNTLFAKQGVFVP